MLACPKDLRKPNGQVKRLEQGTCSHADAAESTNEMDRTPAVSLFNLSDEILVIIVRHYRKNEKCPLPKYAKVFNFALNYLKIDISYDVAICTE